MRHFLRPTLLINIQVQTQRKKCINKKSLKFTVLHGTNMQLVNMRLKLGSISCRPNLHIQLQKVSHYLIREMRGGLKNFQFRGMKKAASAIPPQVYQELNLVTEWSALVIIILEVSIFWTNDWPAVKSFWNCASWTCP